MTHSLLLSVSDKQNVHHCIFIHTVKGILNMFCCQLISNIYWGISTKGHNFDILQLWLLSQ